jgi:hypothetical protein
LLAHNCSLTTYVYTDVICKLQVLAKLPGAEKRRRTQGTPGAAVVHLALTAIGWQYHQRAGPGIAAVCLPFITLLNTGNAFLNRFSISGIDYFKKHKVPSVPL